MPQENPFDKCGGYMNVKISKLENQVSNSANFYKQSNLFDGISIFVNGWTNPTADDLKRIMMTYGGTYHHYERKHTTYIIAENLPDVKIRNMNTSNVISPKWVVDCVKANRILDYSKYLLYTNQKRSQPKLSFKNSYNDLNGNLYHNNNEFNLKRKVPSATNRISPKKSKINIDSEQFLRKNSDSSSEDETNFNAIKTEKSIYDPNIELEILNNQLCNKEEVKSEKHENVINSVEPKIEEPKSNIISKVAKNANDPKFLSEFYNNSRLHHIATLGAGFKQYVNELREKHSGEFPARKELVKHINKKNDFISTPLVMHIDMDCFFVSVGVRKHPELKGFPIAVTHSKGGAEVAERPGVNREQESELYMKRLENRLQDNIMSDKREKIRNGFDGKESLSEIASCSYEARKKGVKNGMFVGQALKLCPDLKTIPYDFEGYKEVAFQLYDTIAQYTLDIEAVSCDEMFVDLTNLLNHIKVDVMDFVTYVREEVKGKTQCPCSAGVGGNRLQSRMATKKAKPNGQFYLDPSTVLQYMANIPIKDLPGVGYSTNCALKQLNWETCGDLQDIPLQKLQNEFGKKFGETLYHFCRGIDNKPLVYGQIRKSVSAEVNYGIRFSEHSEVEKFLRQLCEEVHSRLCNIKRKGKCITLKVMVRAKEAPIETAKYMGHGFCDSLSKSVSLSDYTCEIEIITRTVLTTMKAINIPPKELRGIGIHISKLDDPSDTKKSNAIKNMFGKVIEKQKEKQNTRLSSESESNQFLESSSVRTPVKQNNFHKTSLAQKIDNKQNIKNCFENSNENTVNKINKTPDKSNNTKSKKNNTKNKANTNSTVKSGNIMAMFQNASVKQSKPFVTKLYQANEIDPAILAELPEELQKEILNENQISLKNFPSPPSNNKNINSTQKIEIKKEIVDQSENKKIEVDIEFLKALPDSLRLEIEKEIQEFPDKYMILNKNNTNTTIDLTIVDDKCNNLVKIEKLENDIIEAGPSGTNVSSNVNLNINIGNIFLEDDTFLYIKNWISSTHFPNKHEIDKFCHYVKSTIQKEENISKINESISEFYKIVNVMDNCQWHAAYKTIVEEIQDEMYSLYEKKMILNDSIICDDCN